MWLMVEAVDVWMFRDGRPFNSGQSHFANSLFPPLAFTVQGMLRYLIVENSSQTWQDYHNNKSPTLYDDIGHPRKMTLGKFELRGPYVARWNGQRKEIERLFPLPADVAQVRSEFIPRSLVEQDDKSYRLEVFNDENDVDAMWIPERILVEDYLSEQSFTIYDCIAEDDLFVREYRVGIGKNYTVNTVEDGLLYGAVFIRPLEGVGLLVHVSDELYQDLFPHDGATQYAPFGGEGRMARIERVDNYVKHYPISALFSNAQKLILITPAYFTQGWKPPLNNIVAHACHRPINVGGWDISKNHPRPVVRYVNTSSVYYLSNEADLPNLLTEEIPNGLSLRSLGFGDYLIGSWSIK